MKLRRLGSACTRPEHQWQEELKQMIDSQRMIVDSVVDIRQCFQMCLILDEKRTIDDERHTSRQQRTTHSNGLKISADKFNHGLRELFGKRRRV
jgi:hypothetical protein